MQVQHINESDNFEAKLQEIHQLQGNKIKHLERKVIERDERILVLASKQAQLEQDFQFNLHVIEERDSDIKDLTQNMVSLKQVLVDQTSTIKSLTKELGEAEAKITNHSDKLQSEKNSLYERIEEFKFENKSLKQRILDRQQEFESIKGELVHLKEIEARKLENVVAELTRESNAKLSEMESNIAELKGLHEIELKKQIESRHLFEQGLTVSSDRIRVENERLTAALNEEKLKSMEVARKLNEEIAFQKQRNVENQIKLNCQSKEIDQFKSTWAASLKGKLDPLVQERDALLEKLSSKRTKYQSKVKMVTDSFERKILSIEDEHLYSIRMLENTIRELRIENERVLLQHGNLQAVSYDKQRKNQRDVGDLEDKFKNFRKAQEHSLREILSEKSVLEFHLKQKEEEWVEAIKARDALQIEVKRLKAEMDAVLHPDNSVQEQQQQIQQQQRGKHPTSLSRGRKKVMPNTQSIMFEEDAVLAANHQLPTRQDNGVASPPRKEAEPDSYEKLFSDDMGPASPLRNNTKNINLDFLSNNKSASLLVTSLMLKNRQHTSNVNVSGFQRQSQTSNPNGGGGVGGGSRLTNNSRLQEKLASYESEISAYKNLIETLALEMENVNRKMQLSVQESDRIKEENAELKHRIAELQMDIMNYREKQLKHEFVQRAAYASGEEINEKNGMIEMLSAKLAKAKSDVDSLKNERDRLIAISTDLRQKLLDIHENPFEGGVAMVEEEKLTMIANNNYDTSVREMLDHFPEAQFEVLQNQQQLEQVRNGQRVHSPPQKRSITSLEQLPSLSMQQLPLQNQIENMMVVSNQKPLQNRSEEPRQAHYVPNSLKATPSQRIKEQKRMMANIFSKSGGGSGQQQQTSAGGMNQNVQQGISLAGLPALPKKVMNYNQFKEQQFKEQQEPIREEHYE